MLKKRKYLLTFFLFLITTLFLYRKTVHSRFVFDFIDWIFVYQQQGWHGLLHSFDDPSLHHIYHLFFFTAYKLFGLHPWPWYILFCALHSLNAVLVFVVMNKLFAYCRPGIPWFVSFSGAVLFLVSPYQTEVVVWGATIHYLMVVCIALTIIYLVLQYAQQGKAGFILLIQLLFITGLFTHEIIIMLPFIITVLLFLFPVGDTAKPGRVGLFLKIVLPQFGFIAFYFLLNRIFLGKWIGHYGASTHLKFNIFLIGSAVMKYMAKYVLMAQFLPETKRNLLYALADKKAALLVFSFFVLILSTVAWFSNRFRLSAKMLLAFTIIIFLTLFPVLNLYFPDWINIQADRLGYFASVFIYTLIPVLLYMMLRNFSVAPLFLLVSFSICALYTNTTSWSRAGNMTATLERNFPQDSSKHYYVLNLPDDFNGAYMFRCRGDSKLTQKIKMDTGVDRSGSITEVLAYNLQGITDSVIVTILAPDKLKVELSHWGNWYWRNFEGATSYNEPLLKVDIDEYGHSYIVTFKRKQPNDVFLYQAGNEWRQVANFK